MSIWIPATITVCSVVGFLAVATKPPVGDFPIGSALETVAAAAGAIIVSLAAWLVWSLMR